MLCPVPKVFENLKKFEKKAKKNRKIKAKPQVRAVYALYEEK